MSALPPKADKQQIVPRCPLSAISGHRELHVISCKHHHVTRMPALPLRVVRDSPLTELK